MGKVLKIQDANVVEDVIDFQDRTLKIRLRYMNKKLTISIINEENQDELLKFYNIINNVINRQFDYNIIRYPIRKFELIRVDDRLISKGMMKREIGTYAAKILVEAIIYD